MTQNAVFGSKSCEFYEKLEPYYSKSDMEKGIQNPAVIHFVGFRYVGKPWSQPCYHPYNDQWLYYYDLISNSFDPKCNTIKKKKKKYGLFREIICYMWNNLGKLDVIRNLEFIIEKKHVRNKCKF